LRRRRPVGRFLARTALFLAAAPFRRYLEAEMSGLRVLVSTADRTMARSVFAAGDWDPLLADTVFQALGELGWDARGSTFVEVGSNFGLYCLPAVTVRGFARAVAYEPDPASFALLRANIDRNGLADRVRPVQVALSDRASDVSLWKTGWNGGDNRVVDAPQAARGRGEAVVRVSASTFDREVAAGTIDLPEVGLLWLDVQGHEAEVLAGARTLLASDVPLVVEYSSALMTPTARRRLEEIVADSYDVMVDLGWSALTDRIRYQPASAIRALSELRAVETDLLLFKRGPSGHPTFRGSGVRHGAP
jgi:FkbM family methyltransferase